MRRRENEEMRKRGSSGSDAGKTTTKNRIELTQRGKRKKTIGTRHRKVKTNIRE